MRIKIFKLPQGDLVLVSPATLEWAQWAYPIWLRRAEQLANE